MRQPKFTVGNSVAFKIGNEYGLGTITGGTANEEKGWVYYVLGYNRDNETTVTVREENIMISV